MLWATFKKFANPFVGAHDQLEPGVCRVEEDRVELAVNNSTVEREEVKKVAKELKNVRCVRFIASLRENIRAYGEQVPYESCFRHSR